MQWFVWDSSSSFFCFVLNHYVILNKDTSDKDSAKISWWESIPVLESPPWFNGHWAFMAAIWTFDTEGYLWCTISDILYLENDGNYPHWVPVYTQNKFFFTSFPSCLWIFIPSDKLWKWLLYAWIQELLLHHECHQISFLWEHKCNSGGNIWNDVTTSH